MDVTTAVVAAVCAVVAVLVITFGIAALMGAGRAAQGGPRPGSLERDDDEEQR